MKYLLIGIILGMLLHKTINYAYDYSFQKAFMSDACSNIMSTKNKTLTDRFDCTYKEMGIVDNLKYLLMRPQVKTVFNKEFWIF